MNKLIIVFVSVLAGVVLLFTGCVTTSDSTAKKDEGWIEMRPLDSNDSGVINPDDYK